MFAVALQALMYLLGGMFCLCALYGFWRGLGLRPHAPEHRAAAPAHWWFDPQN